MGNHFWAWGGGWGVLLAFYLAVIVYGSRSDCLVLSMAIAAQLVTVISGEMLLVFDFQAIFKLVTVVALGLVISTYRLAFIIS